MSQTLSKLAVSWKNPGTASGEARHRDMLLLLLNEINLRRKRRENSNKSI